MSFSGANPFENLQRGASSGKCTTWLTVNSHAVPKWWLYSVVESTAGRLLGLGADSQPPVSEYRGGPDLHVSSGLLAGVLLQNVQNMPKFGSAGHFAEPSNRDDGGRSNIPE